MILPVPPIPPVGKILSRPYEGEIGNFQEKKASIDRISTLILEHHRKNKFKVTMEKIYKL